ncbi:hypothetical protein GGF46_003329 [Coemansia sp. RSA 552]|nr:hypothetical protein GGF46_003329 [Coemansia sp. RSA 552]
MSYALRTRQGVLVVVGVVYALVLAWFNRQPIPGTTLVHETDAAQRLRATGAKWLGAGNRDMYWLEPAQYASGDGAVVDEAAGLLHIRVHTEYRTGQAGTPLGGLVKVYRKGLGFVGDGGTEGPWELIFVDRLPGPVQRAHLDRTRLRNEDGTYARRNLAVLYSQPADETVAYRVRIYDVEKLGSVADPEGGQGGCPDDDEDVADAVYAGESFGRCGRQAVQPVDFGLPGALPVQEFSLRGNTLLYSRLNDVVRFRALGLPVHSGGALAGGDGQQTRGPALTEYLRDVGPQAALVQLHSTRPHDGIDVFMAHGTTSGDTFFFSFSFLQNTTRGRWVHQDVKRYRLPVHQQFSGLSRDELRLVNDPPLVDQAGLTAVFYFKATDVIVAVDTQWFRDHGRAGVAQLQRVRESRPPYISTLNSPVAVNLTLDDSGALLAMATVDDELFVFARASAASSPRILDYRRYFRTALHPWPASDALSSVDALDDGDADLFNWRLVLTWHPPARASRVSWDEAFAPDASFPSPRPRPRPRHAQPPASACLRFLRFGRPEAAPAVRIAALSVAGILRLWDLDAHAQPPHVLWPFVTGHWGLLFILAAVVACCVYNERRWG